MSQKSATEKKTSGKPRVGDGTPGPGRPKGVPNKATRDLREMIMAALDGAGGQEYLQRQADENPVAFMTLVGKVLPKEVTGANGKDLIPGTIKVEWVAPKP